MPRPSVARAAPMTPILFEPPRVLVVCRRGPGELLRKLRFFGIDRARLVASQSVQWENDPWARGAYAVFGPWFPCGRRRLLALPAGLKLPFG